LTRSPDGIVDEIDIQIEKDRRREDWSCLHPEIVINLAALPMWMSANPRRRGLCHQCRRNAACGPRSAEIAMAKVVYLSTDYVFDGKKREPYVESDLPNPLNVYGRSKLQGERYVQEMTEDGVIVRTEWSLETGNNFVASILRQQERRRNFRSLTTRRITDVHASIWPGPFLLSLNAI